MSIDILGNYDYKFCGNSRARVSCTLESPAMSFEPIKNNRLEEYFTRLHDGYYRTWDKFLHA